MNTRLAKLLSVVFNPLLMTSFMLASFYFFAPQAVNIGAIPPTSRWFILGFTSIYTFLMPIALVYLLYRFNWIQTLTLKRLSDRRLPYLITIVLYLALSYFLYTRTPQMYTTAVILFLVSITILVIAVVSLWWQISAHSAAMGGAVGIFAAGYLRFYDPALLALTAASILLAGAIMTARLSLQVHTLSQTVAGFMVGLVVASSGYFIL